MKYMENDKITLPEDHPGPCPRCGGMEIHHKHATCLCNCEPTCWTFPICDKCGYEGYANSEGNSW